MSLTLQFHPDWPYRGGLVIEPMIRDGRYRSQFETRTSNGGLTAYPDGDRWRWERQLFDRKYDPLIPATVLARLLRPQRSWDAPSNSTPASSFPPLKLMRPFAAPDPAALAQQISAEITPDKIAEVVRGGDHRPQTVKHVWHLLARFGRQAQ